ncbi:hypothetical protein B0T19DRAFT_400427 [Cercophora scortea]|uniref:Uncharacterized protein n=1 Tax=Cercophora scortea TaxID=314031 RepID=A0AAE0IM07_9PEZI|nr:hypothetical protein B0T19DRAFT_400427 [Cercophora scortea]
MAQVAIDLVVNRFSAFGVNATPNAKAHCWDIHLGWPFQTVSVRTSKLENGYPSWGKYWRWLRVGLELQCMLADPVVDRLLSAACRLPPVASHTGPTLNGPRDPIGCTPWAKQWHDTLVLCGDDMIGNIESQRGLVCAWPALVDELSNKETHGGAVIKGVAATSASLGLPRSTRWMGTGPPGRRYRDLIEAGVAGRGRRGVVSGWLRGKKPGPAKAGLSKSKQRGWDAE